MRELSRLVTVSPALAFAAIAVAQSGELPPQCQPKHGGLEPDEARRLLTDGDRALLAASPAADPTGASAPWIRTGMQAYYKGNYNTAVRAFNIGWLTMPSHSDAVAAMGIAVGARDGACRSLHSWTAPMR
jgi:hypothetical protein